MTSQISLKYFESHSKQILICNMIFWRLRQALNQVICKEVTNRWVIKCFWLEGLSLHYQSDSLIHFSRYTLFVTNFSLYLFSPHKLLAYYLILMYAFLSIALFTRIFSLTNLSLAQFLSTNWRAFLL